MNVLRLSLHPRGLAPQIANLAQWRKHLFERLRQQIAGTADPTLVALLDELRGYPVPEGAGLHLDGNLLNKLGGALDDGQFSSPASTPNTE